MFPGSGVSRLQSRLQSFRPELTTFISSSRYNNISVRISSTSPSDERFSFDLTIWRALTLVARVHQEASLRKARERPLPLVKPIAPAESSMTLHKFMKLPTDLREEWPAHSCVSILDLEGVLAKLASRLTFCPIYRNKAGGNLFFHSSITSSNLFSACKMPAPESFLK